MGSRIPPLLEAYLRLPPEASLVLLTGVLGSTTNWLVQRYLYSLLSPTTTAGTPTSGGARAAAPTDDASPGLGGGSVPDVDVDVLFVSFLRDYAFWREGVGRLGLDLDAAARKGRLVYVDALDGLFSQSQPQSKPEPGPRPDGRRVLTTPTVDALRATLEGALAQLKARSSPGAGTGAGSRTVLILDQPDLLLAAAAEHDVSAQALHEMLLDMRENVHATIVTLSADEPLIASQSTTLEREHAAFTLSVAHDARLVLALRMLDTGTAKDVSGVLRITAGGQHGEERDGESEGVSEDPVDERELLYFVGGDGGVRVFERGQ